MSITATELKNNLGKYLLLSATEDIFITKNGKVVAKLTNPYQDRVETAKQIMGKLFSLVGILEVTGNDCVEALGSPINDYENAVMERMAARKNMDYIVTHNIKDYQLGNTKIILPDNFVKLMEEE